VLNVTVSLMRIICRFSSFVMINLESVSVMRLVSDRLKQMVALVEVVQPFFRSCFHRAISIENLTLEKPLPS
jgi:hypothetical protein